MFVGPGSDASGDSEFSDDTEQRSTGTVRLHGERAVASWKPTNMPSDRYLRWRLILGREAEQDLARLAGCSGGLLGGDLANLDEALGQIYGGAAPQPPSGGKRGAGLGSSAPRLAQWLGDIRSYFAQDVVAVIQRDAIERKGLKQL